MKSIMKPFSVAAVAIAAAALLLCASPAHAGDRKALDPAAQKAFLATRTSAGIGGTFDSFCSTLFAFSDVVCHTDDGGINSAQLGASYPDSYQPTWAELFDAVARQTHSSWKYDAARDYWVFAAPAQPLPYEIALAQGWKSHDEGMYVGYYPAIAPAGMDIYMLGRYSAADQKQLDALTAGVKVSAALAFARDFKEDVTAKDMKEVPVGQTRGLYFEAKAPTGIVWRQWAVAESGRVFVIVSAIKPEQEKQILPDVLKMVASFRAAK